MSSRPDLLPSEYLEELQKLQDDVPRFSNELAFKTVEEELGVKFNDVFELVQEEPVAAASIGQVCTLGHVYSLFKATNCFSCTKQLTILLVDCSQIRPA